MSKKALYLTLALIVILIIGGGGFLLIKSRVDNPQTLPNIVQKIMDNTLPVAELLYEDESGFSFKYPKGVDISDVTPNSDDYYSVLELIKDSGKIKISVSDTKLKTIDAPQGTTLSGATSLGSVPANQYYDDNHLYTVAVDQGVLYFIEGPKGDEFWEETQNILVDTFAFAGTQKSTTTGSGTSSETIYESDEVVE